MPDDKTKKFVFYPGSFWLKRMGFILLTFSIGPNLFLDQVQERLLIESERLVIMADKVGSSGKQTANIVAKTYDWLLGELFPNTADELNKTAQAYNTLDEAVTTLSPVFNRVSALIRWTSTAIWFPILAVALPWLFLDLIYGDQKERRFVSIALIISAFTNIITYSILTIYLSFF